VQHRLCLVLADDRSHECLWIQQCPLQLVRVRRQRPQCPLNLLNLTWRPILRQQRFYSYGQLGNRQCFRQRTTILRHLHKHLVRISERSLQLLVLRMLAELLHQPVEWWTALLKPHRASNSRCDKRDQELAFHHWNQFFAGLPVGEVAIRVKLLHDLLCLQRVTNRRTSLYPIKP